MEIRCIDAASVEDLGRLLGAERASSGCWCMWFVVPVKQYHAGGGDGNQAGFRALMDASRYPMGLLAYRDREPVGWCAAGPRSRYARAIRTPTYNGRDPSEDDSVWLIPCLFVRKDARGSSLGEQLVRSAVRLAQERGAHAVEAFPYSAGKRQSKETQVGFEPVFARCGFAEVSRPSPSRVLMRLQLGRPAEQATA